MTAIVCVLAVALTFAIAPPALRAADLRHRRAARRAALRGLALLRAEHAPAPLRIVR